MAGVQTAWRTDDERRALRHLERNLNRFRELNAEMPVQQMLILTHVALHGEITQKELAGALGMTTASISRNIAIMSTLPVALGGRPGLGLITWLDHPTDRRAKLVVLTPQGRAFVASLL
jgi:DNA-binding MarR family transcriptional regulator